MNLKLFRKQKKLTQEKVAKMIGMKRTTYANYEQGISIPDIQTLLNLSQLYRISIDELVGNEINNSIPTWQFSDTQTRIIKKLPQLSERQSEKVDVYITALLDANEEIKKELKNY